MPAVVPVRRLRVATTAPASGPRLVRGEDACVWDESGRAYIDLVCAGGTVLLGHSHPAVVAAVEGCRASLSADLGGDVVTDLAAELSLIAPPHVSHAGLYVTGDEALAAALATALDVTGRQRVLVLRGCSDSHLQARLAQTGSGRRGLPGPDVMVVPHGDLDALIARLDRSVAAVIAEPVQAHGRVQAPPPGYLTELAANAHRAGCLVVADETQTLLRMGAPLASAAERMSADIVCLGGGVANGLPLGAILADGRLEGRLRPQLPGARPSPVAIAAAAATLRAARNPTLRAQAVRAGEHLLARLAALRLGEIREVRGRGLIAAVELRHDAEPVLAEMTRRGVLAMGGPPGVIRMLPPMTVERQQLDTAVEALAAAIRSGRRRRAEDPGSVELAGVRRRVAARLPT